MGRAASTVGYSFFGCSRFHRTTSTATMQTKITADST